MKRKQEEVDKNVARDKRLYEEFLAGNKEALNELIRLYRNELIYFITSYVRDCYIAEDISQEVFVYLIQHKEKYDFDYTFRTYLYMIAKSRACNYIKSRKKIVYIEDRVEPVYSEFVDVEEEVFRKFESTKLKDAMKKLKKEYQMVIYLIEIIGLSYKETGLIMNKNLSQIKQLILNARKRLKVFLEQESKEEEEYNEVNGRIHR